jgi:alpha-amylase/alpha-mannosidase (GH57 family)
MPIRVAILWHQHQPYYLDPLAERPEGAAMLPWVRLHATRDYLGMAKIAAQHDVRVTFNLVPSLVEQVLAFADGTSDRFEEAARHCPAPTPEALRVAFEAHPEHQIDPWPRYAELRARAPQLSAAELRDALVWQQLTWFPEEERERVSKVRHLGRHFSDAETEHVFAEARKIAARVVPVHRQLQREGRIEVTTSPYFHPILPLLVDSDQCGEPRPLPPRFAWPDDADTQLRMAVEAHQGWFGAAPAGMWPSEGAVSPEVCRRIAAAGLRWIATDEGILARAGVAPTPAHLCRPWRVAGTDLAIFFRDRALSDRIGFVYAGWRDPDAAARDFVDSIAAKYAGCDGVVSIVLDGENAWSWYADDGRPFLHALYRRLAEDPRVTTTTFAEALETVGAHDTVTPAIGSWIDEPGSEPGVDLGTWIGKPRKNALWAALAARRARGLPDDPRRRRALLAAEGSDWFWWGDRDDEPGVEAAFRDLFHRYLAAAG